jgi:Cof subfamily protein (haloacid dehalogenase superfamily)
VSARNVAAVAAVEAAGSLFVMVTGRPPRWMETVADATGHRGLAICANGALLYDLHTGQVVHRDLLDAATAGDVVAALRRALPGIAFAVERADTGFAREEQYRPRWDSALGTEVAPVGELVASGVVKLLARHEELGADELLAAARSAVGDAATLTHSSSDGLLEVSAAGVSKASGLAAFAARHDVAAADVVAFGDMPNDLPMLTWAGLGVAVANAHPEVLAVADEVTASNDDDGVAQVLERWF